MWMYGGVIGRVYVDDGGGEIFVSFTSTYFNCLYVRQ